MGEKGMKLPWWCVTVSPWSTYPNRFCYVALVCCSEQQEDSLLQQRARQRAVHSLHGAWYRVSITTNLPLLKRQPRTLVSFSLFMSPLCPVGAFCCHKDSSTFFFFTQQTLPREACHSNRCVPCWRQRDSQDIPGLSQYRLNCFITELLDDHVCLLSIKCRGLDKNPLSLFSINIPDSLCQWGREQKGAGVSRGAAGHWREVQLHLP